MRDDRAGSTGWYFSTLAYDKSIVGTSPWLKMVPVGLMCGNDPAGPPLTMSWINPTAPAYAKAHVGVDGRLNGPVDNPASACMSCHGTAQAPHAREYGATRERALRVATSSLVPEPASHASVWAFRSAGLRV